MVLPNTEQRKAVLYCRTASTRQSDGQTDNNDHLTSQETRGREYAAQKGYEVLAVFCDKGQSGRLLDRPNIQKMLGYLREREEEKLVVIIDNISALARDIQTYIHLRMAIASTGATLESPIADLVTVPVATARTAMNVGIIQQLGEE